MANPRQRVTVEILVKQVYSVEECVLLFDIIC
jgi:hypothetical protein